MRYGRLLPNVAVLAIGLFISGCSKGPDLGTVSGVVSQDGVPIPVVLVQFQPVDPKGPYSSAYTDEEGRYMLRFSQSKRGALVGSHEVTLRSAKRDEIEVEDKTTGKMVTPDLPENYKKNLELKFDEIVTSGHNTIDFDLDPNLKFEVKIGKK